MMTDIRRNTFCCVLINYLIIPPGLNQNACDALKWAPVGCIPSVPSTHVAVYSPDFQISQTKF